jgi:DtxR family Mn-dependent transcriptional regulator
VKPPEAEDAPFAGQAPGLTESVENYLKAIYELAPRGGSAGTGQIAERLAVAPASVSGMLRKLARLDPPLVEHPKRGGVSLTREGRQAALRTVRRHRLTEQFLKEVMGYRWDEVHPDAERLEHAMSPLLEQRLARFLRQPRFDPHGDPIPDGELNVPPTRSVPLGRLAPGSRAVVRRVPSDSPQTLRYLGEIGLVPGARLRLVGVQPADGTLRVALRAGEVIVGPPLAERVLVEEERKGWTSRREGR